MANKIEIWSCEYVSKIPCSNFLRIDETKEIKRIEVIKEFPCKKEIEHSEKYCIDHKMQLCQHEFKKRNSVIYLEYNGDGDGYSSNSDYDYEKQYWVECTKCKKQNKTKTISLNAEQLESYFQDNQKEFDILLNKLNEWEVNY